MTRCIIAMLPTYNEADNIGPLLEAILELEPEVRPLVVDDDSPDGTWRMVRERAEIDSRIMLLHRTRRRGRGLAGIAGFREALRQGADWVVEMDADWSHDPKWIPAMLDATREADVVIGSRLVPGGGEQGRPFTRTLITRAANCYIRTMLGLPVRDATSGFRLFSRECLEALPWDDMRATGPEVVQEVLLAAHARGFAIAETPIVFVDRRHGESTFNKRIMLRSLAAMWRLRLRPGPLVPPRDGLVDWPWLLARPASWLYGAGRAIDRLAHRAVPGMCARVPCPTISVGNLTVGGTGKTPFVAMLARQLLEWGRRPAILSRGYGAVQRARRIVTVSDGRQVKAGPDRAGDEPALLARTCPGVMVFVHRNRHAAGLYALRHHQADALLLDDAFQHDRLARNLDIVLWDLTDDPQRMRLLPLGRLREGLGALRRAAAIVLTHAEYLPPGMGARRRERTIRKLKRHAPGARVFEARTRLLGFTPLGDWLEGRTEAREPRLDARPVIAVSALARPRGFHALLEQARVPVAQALDYPDHHPYGPEDVAQWRATLDAQPGRGRGSVVTTAKDAVKLAGLDTADVAIHVAEVEMGMTEPEAWHTFIEEAVARAEEGDSTGSGRHARSE